MTIRVLSDYHHSDLAFSLKLLFEKRFDWELYHPIGMEWYDEDYWAFERAYHGDAVARQYLVGVWPESVAKSTDEARREFHMGTYGIDHISQPDGTHPGHRLKGVTLEQARSVDWDIVIASVPDNEPGLARFARERGARYGVQIGNQWQDTNWNAADFGLVSATLHYVPPKPHVIYRQEFPTYWFHPNQTPPRFHEEKSFDAPWSAFRVASFVQCLSENPKAFGEFHDYASTDDSFAWRIFGSYGSVEPDHLAAGNCASTPEVARQMQLTDAIWHTKEWSDGYGHVIHNAFAVGRPVFGRYDYYADKLAGPLWVDGVTSIDIGRRSKDEVLSELRRMRDDRDYHLGFCERAATRFREVVSFDDEADQIRTMLDGVLSVTA